VLLRALSSSVTCSLLILSPAKAVNQVDLAARRKESVPFDQVSVTHDGLALEGRDAQVVPSVARDGYTDDSEYQTSGSRSPPELE
jgi:hypothetical protein